MCLQLRAPSSVKNPLGMVRCEPKSAPVAFIIIKMECGDGARKEKLIIFLKARPLKKKKKSHQHPGSMLATGAGRMAAGQFADLHVIYLFQLKNISSAISQAPLVSTQCVQFLKKRACRVSCPHSFRAERADTSLPHSDMKREGRQRGGKNCTSM